MTPAKILGLAAVLLGLVLYIVKIELPGEKKKAAETLLLKEVTGPQLKRIEIEKGGEKFAFKNPSPAMTRSEDESAGYAALKGWELEGVEGAMLDQGALNTLVSALLGLKLESPLDPADLEKDLSVYGLASPELRVKVESTEGAREVLLGKMSDYVHNRYAKQADSDALYLIPEELYTAASKSRDDFRDRSPIGFDLFDASAVTIEAVGGKKTVLAKEGEKWVMKEPMKAGVDESHLAEIFRKLRSLQVKEFVDPPNAKPEGYNLQAPDARLSVTLKDKTVDVVLSAAQGGDAATYFSVSGTPTIYKAEGNAVSAFAVGTNELREKKLFQIDPESVQSFKLSQDGGPLEVAKADGGGWTVNGKPGDEAFITDYLKKLSELEANGFPPPGATVTIEKPALTAVVKTKDGKEQTLVVGQTEEREKAVVRASVVGGREGEPFFLSDDDFATIAPREEIFVKTEPTPAPAAATTPAP